MTLNLVWLMLANQIKVEMENQMYFRRCLIQLKVMLEKAKAKESRQGIQRLIVELCLWKPLQAEERSNLLKRNSDYLKTTYLQPMVKQRLLPYTYRDMPRHPRQAYTVPDKRIPEPQLPPSMERRLQITGKGNIAVTPDLVILAFSAKAFASEYAAAIQALNDQVEALREIIESKGIPRQGLKTKDFGIRKETSWNKKLDKYEFIGYEARHRLELELPLSNELVNALLLAIASSLDELEFQISFGVRDSKAHQRALVKDALAEAQELSILIADTTRVALKEILSIDYSFHELHIRSESYNYALTEPAAMTAAAPDFNPDDIKLTEHVTVTWRIV
jgi:uncharacterized protein YggE